MGIDVNYLEQKRREKGYTQRQLANLCDFSFAHYNRIVMGRVSPRIKELDSIFEILELTSEQRKKILGGND